MGIGQGVQDAFPHRCSAGATGQVTYPRVGDVVQEGGDPAGGIEDGRRMLGHVSDEAVGRRHADVTGDACARRELTEEGQPRGRLPAPRGTHQCGDPAGQHPQTHCLDDRPAAHLYP